MTHVIEGFIVPAPIAQTISAKHAFPVLLSASGVAFIPMTDLLLDRLAVQFPAPANQAPTEFSKLSPSAVLWLEELSAMGHVAYIESEYFGGVGVQAAAVWEAGKIVLGPRQAEIGPINDALKLLGVIRVADARRVRSKAVDTNTSLERP